MRLKLLRKMFGLKEQAGQLSAAGHDAERLSKVWPSAAVRDLAGKIERLAPEHTALLLEHLRTGLEKTTPEAVRYQAAEALSSAIYPKYKFSEFGRLFLEDEAFLDYYTRFMDIGNWHSLDRKYTAKQLMKLTLSLPGDAVECGTYKGATAYLMCHAYRGSYRVVHLFDSFEGLSTPGHRDGDYWVPGALSATEETLHKNLAEFDNYRSYKGWIPERFDEVADRSFGFLHIDVDLYQPTLDTLRFFYERMNAGGLILMDDYGFSSCPGSTAAADGFFKDKPEKIVMLTTGQAVVQKQ